jgi:predicted O-linked N-acetylglucosamine transferase (SPINDLY family)
MQQLESTIAALRQAIAWRPGDAEAHFNLAQVLSQAGRPQEAIAAYQQALGLRPNWAKAHYYCAATLLELERPAEAVEHYRTILQSQPARSETEHSLGHALMLMGRIEEAKAAYARAEAADPACRTPMSRLFRESLAEVIPPDREAIEQYQARAEAAVSAFAREPFQLDLAELQSGAATPSPMLAYYGVNVRPIMEQYAQAIARHITPLASGPRRGKPKLGIVVSHAHEVVFARCWGGIAERLSRELFDVRIICSQKGATTLQGLLSIPADEYLPLPGQIQPAATLIDEQNFDWLHYWEIGTDWANYYLPFFRPARGQSSCWGWPVTSGNPRVDSYLSCAQLEPPDAAEHYTERLVLLEHLPTYYVRPSAASTAPARGRLGLAEGDRLYLCTQNLRKYHPDFDALLAEVLRSDPQGLFVMIADSQASITELLLARFRRTMPDVVSRVRVAPRMPREEYLALVAAADVALDTLHYGSGANTVYDTVAVGTPLVTLPGEFHRSRWATAVNRRLGLTQLIAGTPQEYVATAVQVARDADLRRTLHRQILAAGEPLFADAAVVVEHQEYFRGAIAATRR